MKWSRSKEIRPDASFDAIVDLYGDNYEFITTVAIRVDVVDGIALARCNDSRAKHAVIRSAFEIGRDGLPV